jgi:elongation factor Ts
MMDCKKALLETDGDMEAASEFLRKSGLVKADKKATRIAAEGKIAVAKNEDGKCVLVEINCETDFVAKDENFAAFSEEVATAAVGISADDNDMDALMAASVGDKSMEDYRQAMVAKIGENIQVRRFASMGGSGTTVGSYIHMNKIGVLVELEGGTEELAVDVAMHVAAMNPQFATADDVDEATLEKERRILTEQALESGKPKEIVDKMVEGRVRKYLEEICLVSQTFVKTNDKTVGQMLKDNGATMKGFKRIAVGEGIEKKQEDFAAEVAKAAGKA